MCNGFRKIFVIIDHCIVFITIIEPFKWSNKFYHTFWTFIYYSSKPHCHVGIILFWKAETLSVDEKLNLRCFILYPLIYYHLSLTVMGIQHFYIRNIITLFSYSNTIDEISCSDAFVHLMKVWRFYELLYALEWFHLHLFLIVFKDELPKKFRIEISYQTIYPFKYN